MGAHADGFAPIQHNNLVRVTNGADALGHDDLGDVVQLFGQPLPQLCVGAVVQRGEGVVEYQNFRLAGQRPGNGKPLLLAAGDITAQLGNVVIRPFRQLIDKFLSLRKLDGAA